MAPWVALFVARQGPVSSERWEEEQIGGKNILRRGRGGTLYMMTFLFFFFSFTRNLHLPDPLFSEISVCVPK